MEHEKSMQIVKDLSNMRINNQKDINNNQRYYWLHDSFPPVDHENIQKHFRAIAQNYLAVFNGQGMHLDRYSFRESSLNGFDSISFEYPQYKTSLVVDYLYDGTYRILWLGTDQRFQNKNSKIVFQEAKNCFAKVSKE